MLARGLRSLSGCVALVLGVVELLFRNCVGRHQLLHALVEDLGIGGVGCCRGIVGLRLIDFLTTRTVLRRLKSRAFSTLRCFSLFDLFWAIAAEHLVEVRLCLVESCLRLRTL